ncbi:MAG: sigma 54-interacting transcriptional regulator [Sorangiineae bacterium]|nr:sigma 54-interacting transcriptional regulator [Polyangiaceae bacterium]MEB2323645.1 sigma 54-interacting transcriptional regulator [Sorangiineae bacterium]
MSLKLRRAPPPVRGDVRRMLEGLPEPAILLTPGHEILAANTAYREKYGDVGETCYSASHDFGTACDKNGEACPLRATIDSGRRQRVFHIQHGAAGPTYVDIELEPVLDVEGRIAYLLERIHEIPDVRVADGSAMVGRAPSFLRALGLLQRAAPSDVPVLILGESGTGKELAARAVHQMSARRGRPFMPVECSGLPESLFESELFGYEQGAFTGAQKSKRGLVDATAGGTLFLDEIGDVPLSVQVKLLRLLETGTFRKVGGIERHRADFRLVCATHRDLAAMVREGSFRQDLYYRINAFPVMLPPLRDRRSDIARLSGEFLSAKHPDKTIGPDALARLTEHDWPGNIRELRNVVERMALLTDGDELRAEQLPPDFDAPGPREPGAPMLGGADFLVSGVRPLDELEAAYLSWAVARTPDRASLARALGVSERTLYRKLDHARRWSAE